MRDFLAIAVLGLIGLGPVTALAGDPDAGRAKTETCSACHGLNGIGVVPDYPNLAGQNYWYLVDSVKAYKSGARKNPLMMPMVAVLGDQDIDDLAAYYSGLDIPRDPGPTTSVGGDPGAGRAKSGTCSACHGEDGIGIAPTYPNLRGQKEKYLFGSLRAYQSGARGNPLMRPIVASLSDQDMRDLAAYYASLGR